MVFATKNIKALNREDDLLQNMVKNKKEKKNKSKIKTT
jgi:hypothetical protein